MSQRGGWGDTRTDVTTPQPACHQETPPCLSHPLPPRGMRSAGSCLGFPQSRPLGRGLLEAGEPGSVGAGDEAVRLAGREVGGRGGSRLIFKDKPHCVCPSHILPGCPATCRRNWHVATALGSGGELPGGHALCPWGLGPRHSNKGTRDGGSGPCGVRCTPGAKELEIEARHVQEMEPDENPGHRGLGAPRWRCSVRVAGRSRCHRRPLVQLTPTCVLAAINRTVSTPAAGSKSALPHD